MVILSLKEFYIGCDCGCENQKAQQQETRRRLIKLHLRRTVVFDFLTAAWIPANWVIRQPALLKFLIQSRRRDCLFSNLTSWLTVYNEF